MTKSRTLEHEKTKPNKANYNKGKSDRAKGKRNWEFYALMLLCTFELFAKQTQFWDGQCGHKVNDNKEIRWNQYDFTASKTKPIKANLSR